MNRKQIIEYRELPYNYCWWCSKLLMRITRGPNKGSYSFNAILVDDIIRYIHKSCKSTVKSFYKERFKDNE